MADSLTDARADVDPDPFSIGIAIFSAMAGGAAFLETRRTHVDQELTQRREFRAAWYRTRRSLLHFKHSIDEFETHMLEDGYSRKAFRIGAVRLTINAHKKQQMRRLKGQTLITANMLGDNLDDLSDFLGPGDQRRVNAILVRLAEIAQLPDRYGDLIRLGREALDLYGDLLEDIGDREGFDEDADYTTSSR